MTAGKIAFVSLLFLAIMLQMGFCAWSQALDVFVADQNGLPVSGASVKVAYQKASGTSGNDGLAVGKTNDAGKYYIGIENTVPEGLESRLILVEASAYGWQGEQEVLAEDGSGAKPVLFAAPFALSISTITVFQASGLPAIGASVYISGSEVKRTTDYLGKTSVYSPSGSDLSGFVSYGSEGDYFSSFGAIVHDDGSREIVVNLPARGDGGAGSGSTVLSVTFIAPDKSALAGEKVVFSYGGKNVSAYTDAAGVASVDVDSSGEVRASVRKNDHDYEFSFNVTADGNPKSETVALAQLLKIDYFESRPDGDGCYQLAAKVSDPRANRPITVKMMQVNKDSVPVGEIKVAVDENGVYSGRVCVREDVLVKVVASNAYETTEKAFSLTAPVVPQEPQQPTEPQPSEPQPTEPEPEPSPSPPAREVTLEETLGTLAAVVVMIALAAGAGIVFLGRRSPGASGGIVKYIAHGNEIFMRNVARPILEYLSTVFKKKEPPQMSFGQPPRQ